MVALSDFAPSIWSARFLRHLSRNLVWFNLCNDFSSLVSAKGKSVEIPEFTKVVTIRDQVANTALTAPEVGTGSKITLTLDKQKYFNIMVDDIVGLQSEPDILDEFTRRAAVRMAERLDTDAQAAFAAACPSGNELTATTNDITDTDATFFPEFFEDLGHVGRLMDEASVPQDDRWIVLHPRVRETIMRDLAGKAHNYAFMPSTERILQHGVMGSLLGFTMYVSNQVQLTGNAGSRVYELFCGQGKFAVGAAKQIDAIEAYRPDDYFADAVRGLMNYGFATLETEGLFMIKASSGA